MSMIRRIKFDLCSDKESDSIKNVQIYRISHEDELDLSDVLEPSGKSSSVPDDDDPFAEYGPPPSRSRAGENSLSKLIKLAKKKYPHPIPVYVAKEELKKYGVKPTSAATAMRELMTQGYLQRVPGTTTYALTEKGKMAKPESVRFKSWDRRKQ